MAKIEPGSASDGMFDDIDDGGGEEEGSRLPLLIVIALLVLAAFGGVVWLAYNQGLQKGRADAPRPLIADNTPTAATTKGIKVYEQPAPPDADSSEDDSAPPPPTETAKPQAAATAAPKPVAAPPVATTAQTATRPPQPLVTPKADATKTTAKPEVAKPDITKVTPKPPEDTLVATPAPAAGGDYVLQIGSYKSQDEADAAWKTFKGKHAMLAGYASDVKQADIPDKGTWYRLRVSAFSTKDAASSFCAKLKADGGDCLLAKK